MTTKPKHRTIVNHSAPIMSAKQSSDAVERKLAVSHHEPESHVLAEEKKVHAWMDDCAARLRRDGGSKSSEELLAEYAALKSW